ncbi:ABC transporter ATP-binding protein [Pseudorhodoplanes sinuspersici]|uniref:ABC transporter ATP-binding protein n=1 Tax=Pseudorhodoplanes sinuspersici TaxID=1235591 RepID=A0A1W6ZQT8_9HYPH|nr:ABC transporter ATP-binding protein [Pseudorhodoplanes sinuspersici]ARP99763.1 ABC transporter ATP-binding protein [Pseudorhodoplanes sinuspersici]RKE70756.1 branched-chain amino acid transport system ATP-binding protein [Pseudorhodoplanes sinuspersici]
MTATLDISTLDVSYGDSVQALSGISLMVPEGGFTVLLGANGAGKSTVLKAASGILPFENGRISRGTIRFFGEDIAGVPSHQLAQRGLLHVREGRHVFPAMTVEENLAAATFALSGRKRRASRDFDDVYAWFPQLKPRRTTPAGFLSGGEQQMLAIGRALVGAPRLLLVDEASLGLAPLVARDIFAILGRINRESGLAILVVEQNVTLALRHGSYGYVLENGAITLEGPTATLMDREAISSRYLGTAATERTP